MPSTIQYIPHQDIDQGRWDACICQAGNSLIYARADFLNAMSPNWDALVLGDYEAVMPLTWRKKLGIRYLCQPAFCQQLGIFFATEDLQEHIPAFLRKLSLSFRLTEIFLNHQNRTDGITATHTNFVLPLVQDYATIAAAYRGDLVKNLNRTKKFNLQYQHSTHVAGAIDLYRQQYGSRMNMREWDYSSFTQLAEKLLLEDRAMVRHVKLENGELLATGLFLKDSKRIYNLASTTLPNGRTLEANHFLMDALIQEFAGSGLTLDFEGSDLPGVARFYQKFSPVNEPYFFWKSNRLPAVLRWWKK